MLKCQHQETDWSLELLLCKACVVLISVEIALRFRCWRPVGGGSAIAWAPSCSTLLPARLKCGCPTGSDLAIAWTLSWSLCILPAPPSLTAFAIAVCWLLQHDLKDLIQDPNAERRREMTTVSSDSVWCSDNRCTKFSNRRMEALAWVQIETFHRCLSHMVENQLRNHCNFCMRGMHKGSQWLSIFSCIEMIHEALLVFGRWFMK